MKKVLSIVLSLVMVICMMPVMAFADTSNAAYPDIAGEPCEGAVNVLSALGVIDGYEDGTYRPDETITRAELTKIVITALGVADYASATTSSYTDMANAQWAVPFVEYATNLNLVNGYGDGRFGPSDPITYEQAATLIVRAVGYTDDCNEMNGTWPAIYVQKAMALGLFQNVTNGGATGATRGDTAIMLYNALTVDQVYADNDGQTLNKKGANGNNLTMMDTLNANGRSEYRIVSSSDAETAVNSIAGYIGAAAEVIYNKDGDVIALSDIKTNFLTGEYKSNGKFEAEDGTTYTIAADAYKVFTDTDKVFTDTDKGTIGKATDNKVAYILNNISQSEDKTFSSEDAGNTYTIAATVSGKTITGIYSIAMWNVTRGEQVDDSDLAQIDRNQKLLSQDFPLDNDQEIDTNAFILNGVDSLDDIAADDIVYVYTGNGEITRIDVGTETVTGTISRKSADKITIDGTSYEFSGVSGAADISDVSAGDEVTLYLDYQGDIYAVDTTNGASGNFAVVTEKGNAPSGSSLSDASKIELLTADGVKVYEVASRDYIDDSANLAWDSISVGTIVQYDLNNSGQIEGLQAADAGDYKAFLDKTDSNMKITKNGYFDGYNISDSALIFAVPNGSNGFDYSDTDELAVVQKSSVLDTNVSRVSYVVNEDNNRIVCMIIDDSSTSEDQYGVVTSTYSIDGGSGADFYIGSDLISDGEVNGTDPSAVKNGGGLYKITKTTSGDYKFEAATPIADEITSSSQISSVKNGYIEMADSTRYNLFSDVVVYVYDKADDEYSIGSTADLTDDSLVSAKIYRTNTTDSSDDNYNLVDYIVITLN